jgi:2'-5' RNA ligase
VLSFRYKTEKVWDKVSRLDLVFGSTTTTINDDFDESNCGIEAFMEAVDKRIKEAALESYNKDEANDLSDSDEDDDEDDDIAISFRPTGTASAVQKFLEADRSTHFLAIRITQPGLMANLAAVQEVIVAAEPVLREACMRPSLYHITLAMLRLDGIAGIQAAVDAVENFPTTDWSGLVASSPSSSPLVLDLRRLNNFGHRVVYAEVHPRDPALFDALVAALRARLEQQSPAVAITNNFDFVPHLTLAKVSRPMTRLRRSKFIDESYYAAHAAEDFGAQVVDNLQLCIIEASSRYDGFYTTLAEAKL